MLTRLKVSGFKNLVDVDIRFGPFTCIAGANGVGKSNLFDAIQFLSALASGKTLIEAASSIRNEAGQLGDIRQLFHRVGDHYADRMTFEAEMIVPEEATDPLGQTAKASITSLRYALTLKYHPDSLPNPLGALEIEQEVLTHINRSDANKHFCFPSTKSWRQTAIRGERRSSFISTEDKQTGDLVIKLHQDGGSGGRPVSYLAASLPRTVLSYTGADNPTALVACEEMKSWRLLQLEPSALRKADSYLSPNSLDRDGAYLAATLYYLAMKAAEGAVDEEERQAKVAQVYAQVAARLSRLVPEIRNVWVDRDECRELFTLMVSDRMGTEYPARSLSDGTLRFLALVILELDPRNKGVICLEEPENGIHPQRIPKMLQLLQDIACDTGDEVGPDNPLLQVIVNTHSPSVVQQVNENDLLVAEPNGSIKNGRRFNRVSFAYFENTWRSKKGTSAEMDNILTISKLLFYLKPVSLNPENSDTLEESPKSLLDSSDSPNRKRRVVDRDDLIPYIPGLEINAKAGS